tara:strand:- start:323 stop:676 length:354 start_codon:yes stop_codon:yes gene_type:complete
MTTKKGGSRTRKYRINDRKTVPITIKEKKRKEKAMKDNLNNSEKNYFKKLLNKFFTRKKSFKLSPILVPPTSNNFQTKRSNTLSSEKKKKKDLINRVSENVLGINTKYGVVYRDHTE